VERLEPLEKWPLAVDAQNLRRKWISVRKKIRRNEQAVEPLEETIEPLESSVAKKKTKAREREVLERKTFSRSLFPTI
jgi:hypothetical protein